MENNLHLDSDADTFFDKFNHYTHVHIILFSYGKDSKLNLLLHCNQDSLELKEFSTEIRKMETSPTIAAARLLCSSYFGLFTYENMNKISKLEKLTKEDFDLNREGEHFTNNIPWYKLRDTKSFYYWIKEMEDNPIQYDFIEDKIVYLIKIPFLDIEFLNKNLEEINYPYKFEYYQYNYQDKINSNTVCESTFNLIYSFDIEKHITNTHKEDYYVILSCIPYSEKDYDDGGGFLLFSLFAGLYRRNTEKWLYYTASKNEFPEEEILKSSKCRALIVPGSASNIYKMEPHISNSMSFIRNFMENPEFSHVKYMGICFGHQIFAEAMGGKVLKREENVHYIEEIMIHESFWNLDFVSDYKNDKEKTFKIFQVHQDDVVIPPKGIKVYGTSNSCNHEIFVSLDKRVLTFQGHPEYTPEFLFFRTHKALEKKQLQPNYEKLFEDYLTKMKHCNEEIDYELRNICYCFLKHKHMHKHHSK